MIFLPAAPTLLRADEGRLQDVQRIFEAKFAECQRAQAALISGSTALAALKAQVGQLTSTNSDLVGGR